MLEHDYDLLNIYELQEPEGPRFLVAFLEPELARSRGILSRAVVGEFTPDAEGEFDPASFRLNAEFAEAFIAYMNDVAIRSPELLDQASRNPSSQLFLVDPRNPAPDGSSAPGDLLGSFTIDADGVPVPRSFVYNALHVMFDPTRGPSGILTDRGFYQWLHPIEDRPRPASDLPIVPG